MRGRSETEPGGVAVAEADCRAFAETLPALVDGDLSRHGDARAHVATCLRCQAELARYRRTLRVLRGLRNERVMPAPGTLKSIFETLERAGQEGPARLSSASHRAAYVGGAAMATVAAGAAGVLVWVSRRRMGLAS